MATKGILKWGFKSKAERLAKQYREELSINACGPLSAFSLSEHLQVSVYSATEFLNQPDEIDLLSGKNGKDSGWSAFTMMTKAGNRIIVHNSFHSIVRQESNIMHELAHIICKHERNIKEYDFEVPFGMRDFDEIKEEEAKWLGATLQLATPCLLWACNRGMTIEEIGQYFTASVDMVRFRLNITGILKRNHFKKMN